MTSDSNTKKTALLLCNLGTPKSTSVSDIRAYLNEFLMDPYVIDIPKVLRALLVYGLILPFRPSKAAKAYKKIWTKDGSPLLAISLEQVKKVQDEVDQQGLGWTVDIGMRYGEPSLRESLQKFKARGITQIIYLPLYPQYALSSTKTAQVELHRQLKDLNYQVELKDGSDYPFHSHPALINSWKKVIRETKDIESVDHFLFSYHGLPERHIKKIESSPDSCFKPGCCDTYDPARNKFCYRAHCYATTRLIAQKLGLQSHQYSVSFQSRLGRTPWIKPFTDFVIPELAQKKIRHLAVLTPTFVTDCLESLEEIGIRGRELFISAKNQKFTAISCLNTHPEWIKAIVQIAREISTL